MISAGNITFACSFLNCLPWDEQGGLKFFFTLIVFNITTQVEWDIADEWLNWQREEYIPEIMATNLFDDYRIFRLMDIEGDDGPTYTVQYFTSAKDRYEQYIQKEAPIHFPLQRNGACELSVEKNNWLH